MAEINVTLSPALETLPARLRQALDRAHEQSAKETVDELRQQIIETDAIASFSLLRSIEKQFQTRGVEQAWLIGSALPYAPFVEYGRKPGKRPPIDAIVRWIALKPVNTGDRDIRSVAFAIATAIGKRGVKPRYPFRQAADAMRPRVEEIFVDVLKKEIENG